MWVPPKMPPRFSLNIRQSPIEHWVPPKMPSKMPPRFSLTLDLTLGVNAP